MRVIVAGVALGSLAACASVSHAPANVVAGPDTSRIFAMALALSADSMRGRGPWTAESQRAARFLAAQLSALGAKPAVGTSLLVPFTAQPRPNDTVFNVVGALPARGGRTDGARVGITAHLDHLGVGEPDARGDSIYNGFLDDAIGVAMVLDVAHRYAADPGARPLVVAFFNLEEQGLLGSIDLARRGAQPLGDLRLLVGVDAGAPAGEALEWQLMGGAPEHPAAHIADSLARARGWTTTSTPPRGISDVYPFSQLGVPVLFPIPGKTWRGYSEAERTMAMARFDHYHQPSDEPRRDFPLVGTWHFADWLWAIVRVTTREP
ncbi:MAG TPA: M28 family peptidase [Gemmatimonadaceae bacterium]